MLPSILSLSKFLLFAPLAVLAQHNASTANGCNDGYFPGTDTVIFTTPVSSSEISIRWLASLEIMTCYSGSTSISASSLIPFWTHANKEAQYTYQQVMSIIGSFRNITWSGSPYDSVTLNGTDNTVGTARTYNIDGEMLDQTSRKTVH